MKYSINQAGFSALDAVLGIVLVAAIGAAGYFAYQNMHNNSAKTATTSSVSPKPETPTPTPNVEKNGVLNIAQFGVSMTVPSGLSGLSYTYMTKGTKDATGIASTADIANIISAQLKGQQSTCGGPQGKGSTSDGNIASISRSSTQFSNMDGSPYTGALMKQIGANYYFLGLPNGGPCFTGTLAQTETDQRTLIQQAFSSLK